MPVKHFIRQSLFGVVRNRQPEPESVRAEATLSLILVWHAPGWLCLRWAFLICDHLLRTLSYLPGWQWRGHGIAHLRSNLLLRTQRTRAVCQSGTHAKYIDFPCFTHSGHYRKVRSFAPTNWTLWQLQVYLPPNGKCTVRFSQNAYN